MKKKKLKEQFKNIKPVLKYFKEYKSQLILYSIILFVFNMMFVVTGYLMGRAVEEVTNSNVKWSIMFLLAYFFIQVVGNSIINWAYFAFNKIQGIISRKIGFDVYKKTLNLPAVAFEDMSSGEIINRVTNDTETIIGTFQMIIEMISRLVSAIIILVYIFMNSYLVGLEIVVFIILYSLIVRHYTKKLKNIKEETKKTHDKFSSLTTESVRGIREIKTLGIINNLGNKMKNITDKLIKASIKEKEESTKYDIVSIVMVSILEVGSFITIAILTGMGKCSITFFVAMTYYIYRYTWIVEATKSFSKEAVNMLVAFNRIADIINNKLYKDVKFGSKILEDPKGIIEFKNVTFGYKNEDKVLKNMSVEFEPNKKIAIVGASGKGKTTMFNLLTRIFDTDEGEILIDGINIKDLTEESLRNNISIIRQDPFIFNASILDNFKILKEDIKLDEIREYCKLASIDEYIMSLPKGYDTILGEGGVNLSGGQKQRIAIARTLLKKSKVILMDEATSSLDNISQNIIKTSIDKLVHDHTVLIVAHRLSTIIDADIIYVIDDGKVIDKGTHKELMKSCEFYQKLHSLEDKII